MPRRSKPPDPSHPRPPPKSSLESDLLLKGNPKSPHSLGLRAKVGRIIERRRVAARRAPSRPSFILVSCPQRYQGLAPCFSFALPLRTMPRVNASVRHREPAAAFADARDGWTRPLTRAYAPTQKQNDLAAWV